MANKDKTTTIIFNENMDKLIAEELSCPKCRIKYAKRLPYVNVACNNCGLTYTTDFKQRIFTKKASDILKANAWCNTIHYEVSEKFEADLLYVKDLHEMMKSYKIGEIKRKTEEYRRCKKCATCLNCFTCKKCGKTFEKDLNRKKQVCPHCNGKSYVNTYVKEIICSEKNENIKLCSHCNSDKIVLTRSKTKSKCHICGSKKLSEKRSETTLYLTIKRKGAYNL